MTTFLFLAAALVFCIWLFLYLDRLHRKQDTAYKAEQSEPEQNSPEPERPNVYYSKDIRIVSEPNYLVPPFRFDDIYLMKVEANDNLVFVWFFIQANLISIQINDSQLHNEVIRLETAQQRTTPIDLVEDYLYGKKILK